MERKTRSKLKHRNQIAPASIDRLSDLPDGVICQILSFLPTKISVSTSILSKRWRLLWSHVPNLDFKREYFKGNDNYYFSDIIHRVMLLNKSENMITFSLYHIPCNEYQLETWITIAIQRNVRYLDFCQSVGLWLPRCLFACKTLVDLKLAFVSCNPSIGAVSMPSLKKLHISHVECEVDEDIPHLLTGCPMLEELVIDDIFILDENFGCLNISSPTLIRLAVEFDRLRINGLKINAPVLRYLKVEDFSLFSDESILSSLKHISVSPMTSLIEADICLHTCSYSLDEEDNYSTHSASAVKFLNCLSNVKCLKLSGPDPEKKFLEIAATGSFVRFDNLTTLEIKLDADLVFVTKLLEIADNLEVLVVDVGVDEMYWMEPKQVPMCLLSRIRTIRIDGPVCREHKFNMVRYFLRNAQVLERMEIFSNLHETDLKEKFDALQKMSLFERGSKACQLAFY